MLSIRSTDLPATSILQRYADLDGCYTDCFVVESRKGVRLNEFVVAFYTSPIFRIERMILRLVLRRQSTDNQARELADGRLDEFAVWTVEERMEDQLLLADLSGRTRSWMMVAGAGGSRAGGKGASLYFGSAVLPIPSKGKEGASIGMTYSALMGFHKLYSRALLWSAKQGLKKLQG